MPNHLSGITLYPEKYPTKEHYPFNLSLFSETESLDFSTPITMFVGENGSGKSTLLEAIAVACGIYIWRKESYSSVTVNRYAASLHRYLKVHWTNGSVPGSFFGAQIFKDFASIIDEWASTDPAQLELFGGKSLVTQSHGQSLMAFFKTRYKLKGLYLLDEPETALSPSSQLELLKLLNENAKGGHAQFIVATHSPILLACPQAKIYNFNASPISTTEYEKTEHFKVYDDFIRNRDKYVNIYE